MTPSSPNTQGPVVLSIWRGRVRRRRSMAEIASEVANRRGVSAQALRSAWSTRAVKAARVEAYATIRGELELSYAVIGRYFGRKEHVVRRAVDNYQRRFSEGMAAE